MLCYSLKSSSIDKNTGKLAFFALFSQIEKVLSSQTLRILGLNLAKSDYFITMCFSPAKHILIIRITLEPDIHSSLACRL